MTYSDLLEALNTMTKYQLGCNVTVELGLSEEYIEAKLEFAEEDDVLDEYHPIIYVENA